MKDGLWKRYAPSESQPWDVRRVIHLHRRAAFGASWQEVQRDLQEGPEASIERLVAGIRGREASSPSPEPLQASPPESVADDFEMLAGRIVAAAIASGSVDRLKAWWLFRMIFTPEPLRERLTLMWHNHFATSNQKVRNPRYMRDQNDSIRQFAASEFAELLPRVVKSPAMFVWLDAQANDKRHPNENLARELMELFSLGVGHYTETDVKEAARALTGWTLQEEKIHFDPALHDDGRKTILGSTGCWNADDLLRRLLEHPATARRIAFRICELLLGEGGASEEALDELAAGLRDHQLNIAWGVETVLKSELFFRDDNIGDRPLAPVEYIVGSVRALESLEPPPSTLLLAEWSAAMGQDLFYPPSVFGWPGGRSWLTSRTLIARANFAHAITAGGEQGTGQPFDPLRLSEKYGVSRSANLRSMLRALLTNRSSTDEVISGEGSVSVAEMQDFVASLLASADAQLA